jgi:hypothetical protein
MTEDDACEIRAAEAKRARMSEQPAPGGAR